MMLLPHAKGEADQPVSLRQQGGNGMPPFVTQRLAHAAGTDMLGMEMAAANPVDDLLPDLPQADSLPDQFRPEPSQTGDAALCRVRIEAEDNIRG